MSGFRGIADMSELWRRDASVAFTRIVVADAPRTLAEGRNKFATGKRYMFHGTSITGHAPFGVLHRGTLIKASFANP